MTARGLLQAAALATAAAGAVGLIRQRIEHDRVRRGQLAPTGPDGDLPPKREPGRVGRSVAAWQPRRPTSTLGRAAAAAWASPATAAGLVLAVAGGATPRWDPAHGCLVATGVRGLSGAALAGVGAHANAVGQVVLSRHPEPSPKLLAHEAAHVRQTERLGPLLLPAYVWLGARYGYRDHPLERAARAAARGPASSEHPSLPQRRP